MVHLVVALVAALAAGGCGLTDDEGPLAGLASECPTAIHELERSRGIALDVTFAGTVGAPIRFTDASALPLVAGAVLGPPELAHTSDPQGRWTGTVSYRHSRLAVVLLADALPAAHGAVARVEVAWQRPGQSFRRQVIALDVSTVSGAARVEGNELVVDMVAPAAWGPPSVAAGAEGIDAGVGPDTGDRSVSSYSLPGPGLITARMPVAAFTGAPVAPGTQVVIPLVVRASFAPGPALALEGTDEPLPDYGDRCDRQRNQGPVDRHDFSRGERVSVYVVTTLTVAA